MNINKMIRWKSSRNDDLINPSKNTMMFKSVSFQLNQDGHSTKRNVLQLSFALSRIGGLFIQCKIMGIILTMIFFTDYYKLRSVIYVKNNLLKDNNDYKEDTVKRIININSKCF
jgi:hypothetical protein